MPNILIAFAEPKDGALDAGTVSGTVERSDSGDAPISFSGWLQLVNVLERMVDDSSQVEGV
jgi:hypothetical protein